MFLRYFRITKIKISIGSTDKEKQIKEDAQKEFFAKYQLNAGQGNSDTSITKEQFEAMSLIERSKLKKENEAEYKRLIAL